MAVVPRHDRSPTVSSATLDLARRGRRRSNACCVPIRIHQPDWGRIFASTPPLADGLLDACPPDLDLIPDGVFGASHPCCTVARLGEARAGVVLLIRREKPSAKIAAVEHRAGARAHRNATGVDLRNVQVLDRHEKTRNHRGCAFVRVLCAVVLWQIQRKVRVLLQACWGGSKQGVCSIVPELDQN